MPITSEIRALLWPLRGHHPEMVFTYVRERGEHGRVKGQRYPSPMAGVQTLLAPAAQARRRCRPALP